MPDWLMFYLLAANAYGFLLCALDKGRARRHGRRVPERQLFLACLLGGCFGVYLSMMVCRHKISKARFVWGVPFFCAVYIGLYLYFFSSFWR